MRKLSLTQSSKLQLLNCDMIDESTNFYASTLQISSLQGQIRSQETDLRSQEDELSRTKAELSRLQEEEAQLEQSLLSGRVQLDSIIKSLKTTQEEINQVSEERETSDYIKMFCHQPITNYLGHSKNIFSSLPCECVCDDAGCSVAPSADQPPLLHMSRLCAKVLKCPEEH